MFTGIVEELGSVISLDGPRLRLRAKRVLEDVTMGASIAVNGCCLTVVGWELGDDDGWWDADVSEETFNRTSTGSLVVGSPVNLERPVRLADRLGGHLVQGHVDAVGTVISKAPDLRVRVPQHLVRYIVEKGSITVDGVSLTVVDPVGDEFSVALIPHTCDVTTLGAREVGDPVNIEVDVMAKYAEQLVAAYLDSPDKEQQA
ncbi:MAG: riboflavin synthase [Microthrixaceae bacterium]